MKRLKSLAALGIKFGQRLEDNFYVDLGNTKPRISLDSQKILAWGYYTGFIVMNEETLVNYNAKLGEDEKALIQILENNVEKGTYILLEGAQLPYYFMPNNSHFIKWCIKFTNSFELALGPLQKTNPFYNYRHKGNIEDANFIVIEHDTISYFILLTD